MIAGLVLLILVEIMLALTMLLLAEIVPKSVGFAWAGILAPRLAWPIQVMVWIVYPLAILCRWLSRRSIVMHPVSNQQKKRF